MNAVAHMTALISPDAVRRLAVVRVVRFDRVPLTTRATFESDPAPREVGDAFADRPFSAPSSRRGRVLDIEQARAQVIARWSGDLCGLLNAMSRDELAAVAYALRVDGRSPTERRLEDNVVGPIVPRRRAATVVRDPAELSSPGLRAALWAWGARFERGDIEIPRGLQPKPILLGGHLVVQAAPRGLSPPSASWPRPLPDPVAPDPPSEEPDSVDDLLAAANRAIGVRLGPRGRDKGAWGVRAAKLLGIVERGLDEPDWRGDIEVKTVPIAREQSGYWGVVEDPAIAMVGDGQGATLAKLARTLWLARATVAGDGPPDATIVAWYLLDWDPEIARLTRRYLHERPKGPAGTSARGLYLHKRFFADAGLLAALNGSP